MALIHPGLVQAAVKIQNTVGDISGTGFGFVRPDKYDDTDPSGNTATEPLRWWYVTCAHVIDAIEAMHQHGGIAVAGVEVNESSSSGGITKLNIPVDSWTRHPTWRARREQLGPINDGPYTTDDAAVDVAVTFAPTHYTKWGTLDVWGFPPDLHMTGPLMRIDDLDRRPVTEGDEVFILGFPSGHYDALKNWPVVRHGMVAQIQPLLRGDACTFLVDGSVFGGNSGGPVVIKPQPPGITSFPSLRHNALIGMVAGCQIAPNTRENADLGIIVPVDTINETINHALSNIPEKIIAWTFIT